MAYFLDPALAALAAGPPTPVPAKVLPNKFAKACDAGCGERVCAGAGRLEKKAGAWRVYHLAC